MNESRLEDLLELIVDHRGKTPKKLGGDFVGQGVPVVSAINVKACRLRLDTPLRYVSSDMYRRWMPAELHKGDVLLTSEAPMGEVARVPSDDPLVLGQRLFGLRGRSGLLDNGYLFYALQWKPIRDRLASRATGTTVTGIRQAELVQVSIPFPPFSEQRAIAEVLGALDDKIEANRRMAVTAETLVRAAVSEAQESGEHVVQLGSLVVRVSEVVQPAALPPGTTYVGLEHMPRGSLILEQCGTTENLASAKAAFSPKDILFGKLRPYFKKVALAAKEGVCSTDILVLRPRGEDWAVAAAVLASDEVIDYATSGSEGTRMPRTSWDYMSKCPVRVPGADERDGLQAFTGPILELAVRRAEETSALSLLRDTLLPRLLSGELRVRDADELVGEAV